jgi:hypothetical protein
MYAVKNYTVALLTQRACAPLPIARHYVLWEINSERERIDRVLIQHQRPGDEFTPSDLPPNYQAALADRLVAENGAVELRDPDEGTVLVRLHPR